MTIKIIVLSQVIAALLFLGCSKTADTPDDIASQVSGTYYGEYTYSGSGVREAFVILSRLNDSTVNLATTVSGSMIYSYPVRVYPDQFGTIGLHYERFNVLLLGRIEGKELGFVHNYNSFIGTKP